MYLKSIVLCCLAVHGLHAQSDPIPLLQPPETDVLRQHVRTARATRFNVRAPYSMLEKTPRGLQPFTSVLLEKQPELPYEVADTIVIGDVADIKVFLSSDAKGLYREFSVSVTKILKSTSSSFPVPTVGQSITLLRDGGAARLPDGKVVKHEIRNYPTPELNQRCLFFLTYDPELNAFSCRKFWLVEKGLLRPMFAEDIALGLESTITGKPVASVISLLEEKLNR